jgi:hypothetical protein
MDRRRRGYRPEVVGTLEDRLALSATAPVNFQAFQDGPQMHPVAIALPGSDRVTPIPAGHKPVIGKIDVQAVEVDTIADPGLPTVGIYRVAYQNDSSRAIASATIEDTLGPDLQYVPASSDIPVAGAAPDSQIRVSSDLSYFSNGSHIPPDGQLVVTTNAEGSQLVELKLPDGIAPGAKGYLEFEAEAVNPTSTR